MNDPRQTRRWRALRDRVVEQEPVCWLRIPNVCTYHSETADHVIPVVDRPDLALERANLRGACAACNSRRGSLPVEALNVGARRWAL